MSDIYPRQLPERWVEDEIKEHVPYVEVTLAVSRHQAAGGVCNVRKAEVRGPKASVESTTSPIIHHADVIRALRDVEIMGDTGDVPWFNIT